MLTVAYVSYDNLGSKCMMPVAVQWPNENKTGNYDRQEPIDF